MCTLPCILGGTYPGGIPGWYIPRWYTQVYIRWCMAGYTSLYPGGVWPVYPPCIYLPYTLFVGVPCFPVYPASLLPGWCTARWCVPFYTFSREVREERVLQAKRDLSSFLRITSSRPGTVRFGQRNPPQRVLAHKERRNLLTSQNCSHTPLKASGRPFTRFTVGLVPRLLAPAFD